MQLNDQIVEDRCLIFYPTVLFIHRVHPQSDAKARANYVQIFCIFPLMILKIFKYKKMPFYNVIKFLSYDSFSFFSDDGYLFNIA